MLVVETVVRIRREYAAGKPIKAIARDLKLSRKVVRKAVRAPEGAFSYRREVQPLPKIGPFKERLDVLLAENEARPRRDRLRLTRIWDLLLREGFERSTMRCVAMRPAGPSSGARDWVTERRPSCPWRSGPARPSSSTGATRTWRLQARR